MRALQDTLRLGRETSVDDAWPIQQQLVRMEPGTATNAWILKRVLFVEMRTTCSTAAALLAVLLGSPRVVVATIAVHVMPCRRQARVLTGQISATRA